MTQIEKLVERLRREKGPSSFADVRHLLEHRGWSLIRQVGSHVTFAKSGQPPLIFFPLLSGRWVKQQCVRDVLKRLALDGDDNG